MSWQARSAKRVHPSKLCIGLAAPVRGWRSNGSQGSACDSCLNWHSIWGSEFEQHGLTFDISYEYLQIIFQLRFVPQPAGSIFFLVSGGFQPWGFACLSSWFLLEFLGSACNYGHGHRSVDQAKLGHEQQWVSERSEADTELGPSSWSGEILFGRTYVFFWQRQMSEWASENSLFLREMAYLNLPKFMVPQFVL